MQKVNLFWFRRDLRIHDNAGLYHALKGKFPVVPVFIFDKIILDKLENKKDKRVEFIRDVIIEIQNALLKENTSLEVYYGTPQEIF
jgi:deoxyribodipyrimidine photo-lyase